jgi:hypothetical protein
VAEATPTNAPQDSESPESAPESGDSAVMVTLPPLYVGDALLLLRCLRQPLSVAAANADAAARKGARPEIAASLPDHIAEQQRLRRLVRIIGDSVTSVIPLGGPVQVRVKEVGGNVPAESPFVSPQQPAE